MITQSQEQLINDFKKLITFPNLEQVFFHKIEELKNIHKSDLAILDEVYHLIENKQKPEQGGKDDTSRVEIKFEVFKEGNGWVADTLEPQGYILPQSVINYIVEMGDMNIQIKKGLTFPNLQGQCTLAFEKIDEEYFTGIMIISETKPKSIDMTDHHQFLSREDANNFKMLIEMMIRYPALKKHFFSELELKWKPLLESYSIAM
jgi:hypothetical protein